MKLGEFASRAALESWQAEQLRLLLEVISQNLFYAGVAETLKPSTGAISCMVSGFSDIETLSQFKARCPFTTKAELAADQAAHPHSVAIAHCLWNGSLAFTKLAVRRALHCVGSIRQRVGVCYSIVGRKSIERQRLGVATVSCSRFRSGRFSVLDCI